MREAAGATSEPATAPSAHAPGIDPVQMSVSPEPTEAELAAIITAYRETWPRPSAAEPPKQVSTRWKFSGRWWSDTPGRPRR